MEKLANIDTLLVRQVKEMTEAFTGFETANRYVVADATGSELYYAAEVGRSWLSRNFLKASRPFTIELRDRGNQQVLRLERPFTFYFHRLTVHDAAGNALGTVRRRFSFARRIYTVEDAAGEEVCELFGPILHPWTFQVRVRGQEVGAIKKKWSGLAKEAFTDADNFGVNIPAEFDLPKRCLLLGAVFLIDFVHFEDNN